MYLIHRMSPFNLIAPNIMSEANADVPAVKTEEVVVKLGSNLPSSTVEHMQPEALSNLRLCILSSAVMILWLAGVSNCLLAPTSVPQVYVSRS